MVEAAHRSQVCCTYLFTRGPEKLPAQSSLWRRPSGHPGSPAPSPLKVSGGLGGLLKSEISPPEKSRWKPTGVGSRATNPFRKMAIFLFRSSSDLLLLCWGPWNTRYCLIYRLTKVTIFSETITSSTGPEQATKTRSSCEQISSRSGLLATRFPHLAPARLSLRLRGELSAN